MDRIRNKQRHIKRWTNSVHTTRQLENNYYDVTINNGPSTRKLCPHYPWTRAVLPKSVQCFLLTRHVDTSARYVDGPSTRPVNTARYYGRYFRHPWTRETALLTGGQEMPVNTARPSTRAVFTASVERSLKIRSVNTGSHDPKGAGHPRPQFSEALNSWEVVKTSSSAIARCTIYFDSQNYEVEFLSHPFGGLGET